MQSNLDNMFDFPMEALDKLMKQCEEIAGRWDGKEPGTQEDMAHHANEILDAAGELKELINETEDI